MCQSFYREVKGFLFRAGFFADVNIQYTSGDVIRPEYQGGKGINMKKTLALLLVLVLAVALLGGCTGTPGETSATEEATTPEETTKPAETTTEEETTKAPETTETEEETTTEAETEPVKTD